MAENNRRAGALRERLHFQQRGNGDDGMGGPPTPGQGEFETKFTLSASMKPRTGGEGVDAARLNGRQPYVVTVRNTKDARSITVAWQIVDARDESRVFAVVSPPADPDGRNQWLEFLATEGVAS
jgi:head-tail adaptor